MKETIKSLRIYFFLIGALGTINIGQFLLIEVFSLTLLINLIFSLFFIFLGIRLNNLIPKYSKIIINFFWIGIIYVVITQLYGIITKDPLYFIIFSIIAVLVNLYFIMNIKRLSKQSIE